MTQAGKEKEVPSKTEPQLDPSSRAKTAADWGRNYFGMAMTLVLMSILVRYLRDAVDSVLEHGFFFDWVLTAMILPISTLPIIVVSWVLSTPTYLDHRRNPWWLRRPLVFLSLLCPPAAMHLTRQVAYATSSGALEKLVAHQVMSGIVLLVAYVVLGWVPVDSRFGRLFHPFAGRTVPVEKDEHGHVLESNVLGSLATVMFLILPLIAVSEQAMAGLIQGDTRWRMIHDTGLILLAVYSLCLVFYVSTVIGAFCRRSFPNAAFVPMLAVPALSGLRKMYTEAGGTCFGTARIIVTSLLLEALFLLAYHSFASNADTFQAALFQAHVAIITAPVPAKHEPVKEADEKEEYTEVDMHA